MSFLEDDTDYYYTACCYRLVGHTRPADNRYHCWQCGEEATIVRFDYITPAGPRRPTAGGGGFEIEVENCARCDGEHSSLETKPLNNPPNEYTHYAICPSTKQPILVATDVEE